MAGTTGSSTTSTLRQVFDPSDKGTDIFGLIDPGGKVIKRVTGKDIGRKVADPIGVLGDADPTIKTAAAKKAKEELTLRAAQEEAAALAVAESDIAERKALALPGRGGRSLLIATSPTGTRARTLGGV